MTAEQGYWAAARLPRVANALDDEAPRPSAHARRDFSIVRHALRQIVAFLFGVLLLLAASGPALVVTAVFLSNDTAESEVTYVIQPEIPNSRSYTIAKDAAH